MIAVRSIVSASSRAAVSELCIHWLSFLNPSIRSWKDCTIQVRRENTESACPIVREIRRALCPKPDRARPAPEIADSAPFESPSILILVL